MKKILIFSLLFVACFSIQAQKQITMEDIWSKGTFRPKRISEIRSMNDGEHYCILSSKSIEKYEYKTGKKIEDIVVFANLTPALGSIFNYSFSADEKKILLTTKMTLIYRYSFSAEYYVYDLTAQKLTPLSENGAQNLAEFSPDGKKIAFTRGNNLFIKDLESNQENQITFDGKKNAIINGGTDWVYEEEFSIDKGFFWSENGSEIAFYRFDESAVKEFSFTLWGKLYPDEYTYKYPKAGEVNSVVDVLVYNLASGKTLKLNTGSENDQYIPRFQWTKEENKLMILRMPRLQNQVEFLLADTKNNQIQTIYKEDNSHYIDEPKEIYFLNDKKQYLYMSEKGGYTHIYMFDLTGKEIKQITTGSFDIANIEFVDEKNKLIYYTSAESSPINRDLYSIDFSGKKKTKISKDLGTYRVSFSKSGKYYINNYSNANTPSIYSINNQKGATLVALEDNKTLVDIMKEYGNEQTAFGSFKSSTGIDLNYSIIKPANFDSTKKHPILFYVYGGPGSQTVLNSFEPGNYFWFRSLAQRGYVVISVDGRGTGFRGQDFKKCTYRELGKYESDDQIEAAKYFGNLPWGDKDRIGIFGWSFGGYMSTLAITKGADYFKTAIAVAPVTTWRYYDDVYTERFMALPKDNAAGYDQNSPFNYISKMKGNYLLIHGSADDNVHLQNAMDFTTALVNANKAFDMFIYPNKNHSIYGGNTRLHLYNKMDKFILEKL